MSSHEHIPSHWDVFPLREAVQNHNSGVYKKSSLYGHGQNIVGVSNLYDIDCIDGQLFALVPLSKEERLKHTLNEGDLLYGESSLVREGIARTVYVSSKGAGTAFAWHTRRYSVDHNRILPSFLYYYLQCRRARKHMMDQCIQTAITGINTVSYFECPVLAPHVSEQTEIATTLKDVDALLDGLDHLIAKKRAIKQAAMQQLLTGKTRLPGFSGEWEVIQLGRCGSTYGGITGKEKADFGHGAARYVTFLNVLENPIIQPSMFEAVDIGPAETQNRVRRGDLLFNGTSETPEDVALGACVLDDWDDLYLNSFCFGFRFHARTDHDPLFFAYFFRGPMGRQLMSALAQGATRYNMSKRQFLRLECPLPDGDEQREIAHVLADMDREIAVVQQRRDKTRAIKQGMMQQLLTGRVRLVKPEAAA